MMSLPHHRRTKIHLMEPSGLSTACNRLRDRFLWQDEKGERREIWQNGEHKITVSPAAHEVTCRKCLETIG